MPVRTKRAQRAFLLVAAGCGVVAVGAWACGAPVKLDCATSIPVYVHVDPALAAGSLAVDGSCTSPKCDRVPDSGGCQDWVVTWPAGSVEIPSCELVLNFPDGGRLRQVMPYTPGYWCTPRYLEAGFQAEQ